MPLRTLIRVLVLSVVFLTFGFYMSINEKNDNNVLIKKNPTQELKQTLPQESTNDAANKTHMDKPKDGLAALIGQDVANVEKEFGTPVRIDETPFGYQWYIYNQTDNRYLQVGIENNQVVTIYAIGETLDVAPFEIGQSVEEIFNSQFFETNIDLNYNGNAYRFELSDTDLNLWPMVQLGDIYAQLYIDKFTGSLSSIRFMNAETLIKQSPYELVYSGDLIKEPELSKDMQTLIETGAEQEIFDITNVLRARHKLKALDWDEDTAKAAYEHSRDMAENNDFSHTSKKYGDLANRLKTAKVAYKSAGENIAANYTDGPAVVAGWLNSKGHRESLLNKDYSHIGVGVYDKYYTQNFIQKVEK